MFPFAVIGQWADLICFDAFALRTQTFALEQVCHVESVDVKRRPDKNVNS